MRERTSERARKDTTVVGVTEARKFEQPMEEKRLGECPADLAGLKEAEEARQPHERKESHIELIK